MCQLCEPATAQKTGDELKGLFFLVQGDIGGWIDRRMLSSALSHLLHIGRITKTLNFGSMLPSAYELPATNVSI